MTNEQARIYILDFMSRHKVSQAEFALILGYTIGAVNHWVTGIRDVPELVIRVCLYFDDFQYDFRAFYQP